MNPKKIKIISIILILAIVNFSRLKGDENIRAIQVVSLLVIGALAGILINHFIETRNTKQP